MTGETALRYARSILSASHPLMALWATVTLDEKYEDPPEWKDASAPGLRLVAAGPFNIGPVTSTLRLEHDKHNAGRIEKWLNMTEEHFAAQITQIKGGS
jgi:hypothetical protein